MSKKQKDLFSESEGNAWFERNRVAVERRDYNASDPVIHAVDHCLSNLTNNDFEGLSLLEVGCGEGKRLRWLQANRSLECFGVEPASKAVELAIESGVKVVRGTADTLPFEEQKFDIVVFGFCLYLCDRDDLFKIALEADRVLKKKSWLIVHDFFSDAPVDKPYHHLEGVKSYKMDYRKLWEWHPYYMCYAHEIFGHGTARHSDVSDEWVSTSILRKNVIT